MTSLGPLLKEFIQPGMPKGPSPAFSSVHLIKALLALESGSMGRKALSKVLNLGEGSVRTIIKRLSERGLISVDLVGGCYLTELGLDFVRKVREVLVKEREMDLSPLGIRSPAWAIQVRPSFEITVNITKLRDVAVKNGADGMLILSYKNSRISLPFICDDISRDYPEINNLLITSFELRDGDLILICFAEDKKLAELGALAAAISLFL